MLYASFWRRNLGFFRLAIITNLEYRVNFITDALIQPIMATLIEVTLWFAIFRGLGSGEIGGFGREAYLSYVLWASFIGRISSTWMYEFRMIEEIEMGSVNSLLVRPLSFFEYYLSQFLGYKVVTTAISILVPLAAVLFFHLPFEWSRLGPAMALVIYYLLFVHTLSFCIATMAFRLNKVGSFTVAKNLGLWLLSGELFPLDLLPGFWKQFVMVLPFSNAVYTPVAYLTGRVGSDMIVQGFVTTTIGIFVLGLIAHYSWHSGLRQYSGTGA